MYTAGHLNEHVQNDAGRVPRQETRAGPGLQGPTACRPSSGVGGRPACAGSAGPLCTAAHGHSSFLAAVYASIP